MFSEERWVVSFKLNIIFISISLQRMYEQQRDQLANQQFNIDQTSFALNTVKDTQQTIAAMSAAAKTLKKEQKKININDIENMQDEMEGKYIYTR